MDNVPSLHSAPCRRDHDEDDWWDENLFADPGEARLGAG